MVEAFPYVSYTYHCILDERQTRLTEDDFFLFFSETPKFKVQLIEDVCHLDSVHNVYNN